MAVIRSDIKLYQSVSLQEGETIQFKPDTPATLPAFKLGLLFNFPAVVVAIILTGVADWGYKGEALVLWISAPIVPFIWYAIGREIDLSLGYLHRVANASSLMRRVGRRTLMVASAFMLIVSLAGATPLYQHNNGETYWEWMTIILWSMVGLGLAKSAERRGKADSLRSITASGKDCQPGL